MSHPLSVQTLLAQAQHQLETAGSDEPQANAQWLLASVLGVSRTWILSHSDYELSAPEERQYAHWLKRKAAGEPLAYIVGEQPFDGLSIRVTPDVLIPRPETEELVELVSSLYERKEKYSFLDMCTGSGCIACALAKRFVQAHILAVDKSPKALAVAAQNVKNLHLAERVHLLQSDVWEEVQGQFDLIIANPPYIPSQIMDTLTREVLSEPRMALEGGVDGLDVVRALCSAAGDYLNKDGWMALELCKGQAQAVARGLEEIGWRCEVKKDIVGIERFVLAQRIN